VGLGQLPWAALVAVGGPSPELAEYLWAAPPMLEDGEWSTGLEGEYFALPYTAAAAAAAAEVELQLLGLLTYAAAAPYSDTAAAVAAG